MRSIFIRHGDGEDVGLEGGGDNSLLRYLKFIELNPYNANQLSDNPYKGLPEGMLIYRSCYPIRHDFSSNSTQCAANSVGVNIRIYKMSFGEYNINKQTEKDFRAYNLWREIAFYEYMRENIIKKRVCPNFPILYAYFINEKCKIDFDKLCRINNKGFAPKPRFRVKAKLGDKETQLRLDDRDMNKMIKVLDGYQKSNLQRYAKRTAVQLGGNQTPTGKLRVLSYNVYWKGQESVSGALGNRCNTDGNTCRTKVVRNIKSVAPLDIIGLVEVANFDKLNRELSDLNMKYVVTGVPIRGGNKAIAVTYFSNKLTLKNAHPYESNRVNPKCDGSLKNGEGRPYQILIFNEKLVFINVHMPHDVNVEKMLNLIIANIESVDVLNEIKDYRFIVAGDLNQDIRKVTLKVGGKEIVLKENSHGGATCCDDSGFGRNHNKVVDHILDSQDGADTKIVPNIENPSSDHKPVVAELEATRISGAPVNVQLHVPQTYESAATLEGRPTHPLNVDPNVNVPPPLQTDYLKQHYIPAHHIPKDLRLQLDDELDAYSGRALVALTEAPTYNLISWASKTYNIQGNVRRMVNTGFHKSGIWMSILFQIFAALYTLQIHDIGFTNFTINDNVYIKDLKMTSNVTNHWKYKIDGIDYYIPNYGYLVMVDTNFKDVEQDTTLIGKLKGKKKFKMYSKIFMEETNQDVDNYINKTSFNAFKSVVDPSVFSAVFTNAGGNKPPDDVIHLLDKINDHVKKGSDTDIGEYIFRFMKMFVNNRVGTLLRENETRYIQFNERTPFTKGDILVHEFRSKTYKFVMFVSLDGNNATVLSRDNNNKEIEQTVVPADTLFNYSLYEPITQNYKPTESNLNEDQLLEIYTIDKK